MPLSLSWVEVEPCLEELGIFPTLSQFRLKYAYSFLILGYFLVQLILLIIEQPVSSDVLASGAKLPSEAPSHQRLIYRYVQLITRELRSPIERPFTGKNQEFIRIKIRKNVEP